MSLIFIQIFVHLNPEILIEKISILHWLSRNRIFSGATFYYEPHCSIFCEDHIR